MAAHCAHHDSKAKDCAPRFSVDQFEVTSTKAQPVQDLAMDAPVDFVADQEVFVPTDHSEIKLFFDSSPPQFYLQHHAFLI